MKNKNIRIIISLIFVLTVTFSAFGQQVTRVKDFYSPYFMSGTTSVTDQLAPQSDAVNPASSALVQRMTLDINYSGIIGEDGTVTGYKGHAFNFGNAIPTRVGVFSLTGHLLTSEFPSFYAPLSFGVSGSFSKDLFPDLLIGVGAKFAYSVEPGGAVAFDLGALYLPGDIGFLRNAVIGLSLQDLGWITIQSGYQAPYTVTAGISGTVFSNKDLTVNVKSDVGFPGFKSLLFSVGSTLHFRNSLSVNMGTRMDLYELSKGNFSGLIPSIGINYSFTTNINKKSNFLGLSEHGWNRSEVNIQTDFAVLAPKIWTYGTGVNIPLGVLDKNPPVIKLDLSGFKSESMLPADNKFSHRKRFSVKTYSKRIYKKKYVDSSKQASKKTIKKNRDGKYPGVSVLAYISPNNDGIKDDIRIPISIKDSRFIKGYSFIIKNASGSVVREINNKEKRTENQGVMGIFDRLMAVKSGIKIPSELRWDGFDNSGKVVPDGVYYFHVEAWDDNGNVGKTKEYAIVVDTTPPEVTIAPPSDYNKIFSPNNDGNKDTLSFTQKGSVEDKWIGTIKNAEGKAVKSFVWDNSSPGKVVWNGENDNGKSVSDGVYSYSITSTDRGGNTVTEGFDNIIKNTVQTPITLLIDKQYFSPNNDKIKDSITFTPRVDIKTGIISWMLTIKDGKGRAQRIFKGADNLPKAIIFDGRDEKGIIMGEGTYSALLQVNYANGNKPAAHSPDFTLDITAPSATIRTNTPVFSPNGDGEKDIIKIYQETSLEKIWNGSIKSVTGKVVYEYKWVGTADPEIIWNGIGKNGRLVDDGIYTYQIVSVDRAGNKGESNVVSFRLDTEKTAVILSTNYTAFSPNNDGSKDILNIIPKVTVREGIESYALHILDSKKNVIKTFTGKKKLPEVFKWDGTDALEKRVPDGTYSAQLLLVYEKGDRPQASSGNFIVDTTFPGISVSAKYLLFSPDGDGKKDNITINQISKSKVLWRGEILDSDKRVIKTVFWKNGITDFSWDGTDTAGNHVKDGIYSYNVSAVDEAGNKTLKTLSGIKVDTRVTKVFITASSPYVSPTGYSKYKSIIFTPIVNDKEGIESWTLQLVRDGKYVERTFAGKTRIPEKIIWDGSNKEKSFVEGTYTADFKVIYKKGNEPEARSFSFILDITPPSVHITLSPLPFSPDNDGVNDELIISLSVKDFSGIKNWTMSILDPENKPFIKYSGNGAPTKKIIWNGKSSTGELVYAAMDYPILFTVRDMVGNTSVYKKKIPVDVLVVKEGDHFKINIANIIFKKNSPKFLDDDPQTAATNKFVLGRISEILKKYKAYQIEIRGYAVVTRWADPAAAEREQKEELLPLSKERALTVLNDLVKRGISPSRMTAVGEGGKNPIVPNSDLENRWKNRRVEFILRKK